jgi:hypothetical protein
MNYATGHCFNVDDMFYNFDYSKLKMNCKDCEKINNDPHRDILVKKIFRAGMKYVLNDIVENNNTFVLPTGSKRAEIHVRRTSGEQFKKLRINGKWQDVDLFSSHFSGNELVLEMYGSGRCRTKPIYVDKNIKDKITENTNKGMQYC